MEKNKLTQKDFQTLFYQSKKLIRNKNDLMRNMNKIRNQLPGTKFKHNFMKNTILTIETTTCKAIPEQIIKQYINLEDALVKFAETDNRIKTFDLSDKQKAQYEEITKNLHSKNILKDRSVEQWHDSIITNIDALQHVHKNLVKKLSILHAWMNNVETETENYRKMKKNIRKNIGDFSTDINLELLDKKTLLDLEQCQARLRDCLDDKKHAMTRLQKEYARGINLMNSIIKSEQYASDQTMDHDHYSFKDNLIVNNLVDCIKELSKRIKSLEKSQYEITDILSEPKKKENAHLDDKQNDSLKNWKIRKSIFIFDKRQIDFNPTADREPVRIRNWESDPFIRQQPNQPNIDKPDIRYSDKSETKREETIVRNKKDLKKPDNTKKELIHNLENKLITNPKKQLEELKKKLIAEHKELIKYLKITIKFPTPKNINQALKLYESIQHNLNQLDKFNVSSPDAAKQTMERLHESGIIKNNLKETQNHVRDQKRDLHEILNELCDIIKMTQALLDTRKESAERLHQSAIAGCLSYEDYETISDCIDKVLNDSYDVECQINIQKNYQETIIPKLEHMLRKERNEQNVTNEQNITNKQPVINFLSDALAHEKQVIDNINKLQEYYLNLLKEKKTSITQIRRLSVALTNSLPNTKQHRASVVPLVSAITEKQKNSPLSLNSSLNRPLSTSKRQYVRELITADNMIDKKLRAVLETFRNMTSSVQEQSPVCPSDNPSLGIRDLVLPKYSSLNTELPKQENADLEM